MKPYLVEQVQGPDLSVVDSASPRGAGAAVSPQTAASCRR